ncbi:MAG TPA: aminomethyl-transferring glycine dehydrogenase subunit GcvPA [Thermoplasmata archaeon]|jgi:glycine dehydrogenase subunit 1
MASDEAEMLRTIGVRSVEDLFADIPAKVRFDGLQLPAGYAEAEVVAKITSILSANRTMADMPTFLGGGVYDHFVPASVRAITSRAEFYTSYTPYQPELSQGILQALWEYQSLICELTGMDAANTSMYDGATALGEAARMAARIHGGNVFLVPRALRWDKRSVLENYAHGANLHVKEIDFDRRSGELDLDSLRSLVTPDVCGIYVESPNYFGRFEEHIAEIRSMANSAVLVVGVNPLAQAVVRPPGDFGADIVIGEGQALGNAVNFGGPLLGIFACLQEHVRKMPGRVIGLTQDVQGRRAFCMTLQTREQHIRREKAMSNICTNESLLAVASAAYVAVLGGSGLRRVAGENIRKARRLMEAIAKIEGFTAPVFRGPHFNEFTVRFTRGFETLHRGLLQRGIHGGSRLTRRIPELIDVALFATTERHSVEDHRRLLAALEGLA